MRKLGISLCILMALAGCGTSPEPDYYVLSPVDGVIAPNINLSVRVNRPTLPAYLDRPEIVHQNGEQVSIDEFRRWASPLDSMAEEILASDLRQRLPASTITMEKDNLTSKARIMLDIEMASFNGTRDGAILTGQVIAQDNAPCSAKPPPMSFHETTASADIAQALSDLMGQLADRITNQLQNLPVARCPDAPPPLDTSPAGMRKPG